MDKLCQQALAVGLASAKGYKGFDPTKVWDGGATWGEWEGGEAVVYDECIAHTAGRMWLSLPALLHVCCSMCRLYAHGTDALTGSAVRSSTQGWAACAGLGCLRCARHVSLIALCSSIILLLPAGSTAIQVCYVGDKTPPTWPVEPGCASFRAAHPSDALLGSHCCSRCVLAW